MFAEIGVRLHPSVEVEHSALGSGLVARAPVHAGETLLYCPADAMLRGRDVEQLAATLLTELALGERSRLCAWLRSLPRDQAFSASGCDAETTSALSGGPASSRTHRTYVRKLAGLFSRTKHTLVRLALSGGGLGGCAFAALLRSCAADDWAGSFVRANALQSGDGTLRLVPLFTLLNHSSERAAAHADDAAAAAADAAHEPAEPEALGDVRPQERLRISTFGV